MELFLLVLIILSFIIFWIFLVLGINKKVESSVEKNHYNPDLIFDIEKESEKLEIEKEFKNNSFSKKIGSITACLMCRLENGLPIYTVRNGTNYHFLGYRSFLSASVLYWQITGFRVTKKERSEMLNFLNQ